MNHFFLSFMGLITGLVDSVVGGGGMISLPTLSIAIAPGAHAIGTNKIVGVVGALMALIVYTRKGHLRFKEGIYFCLVCALGSFFGSMAAPHVSQDFFRYLLMVMCPAILYIVWNRDRFFSKRENFVKPHYLLFFFFCIWQRILRWIFWSRRGDFHVSRFIFGNRLSPTRFNSDFKNGQYFFSINGTCNLFA